MYKKIIHPLLILLGSLYIIPPVDAVIKVPMGRIINGDTVPFLTIEEHHALATQFFNQNNHKEAARHFKILSLNFSDRQEGLEAFYYLAICYYKLCEFDWANETFNKYIQVQANTDKFEKVIEYKFAIAEYLRSGYKRRFHGTKYMPKWASGKDLALDIYDEIVIAMPIGDLAPQALYLKGLLQFEMKRHREAVESLQTLIKRFPKHELAPESYVMINKIFLDQAILEFQNPDLLAFAEINQRRFERDFPGESRIEESRRDVMEIKEVYAKGLYDIGQFYEKIKEPLASVVYYQKACTDYPSTKVSSYCRSRLMLLTRGLVKAEETVEHAPEDEELEDFDLLSSTPINDLKKSLNS